MPERKAVAEQPFPPQPTRPHEIAIMLEVFAAVIEDRTATYVSSPFTTGRRAAAWLTRNGSPEDDTLPTSDEFRASVMSENKAYAGEFIGRLREQSKTPIIAPTELADIDGWTQSDYRFFWGRVIERYAATVVFLEGWAHSSGCAYEFLVANRSGARTLREDLGPLSIAEGRTLLCEAIEESDEAGLRSRFLTGVRDGLDELLDSGMSR